MRSTVSSLAAGALLLANNANAISLDINSASSIKAAAKTISQNIAQLYNASLESDGIPGLFEAPNYWWEGGLTFDSLINYWALTGDATYNDAVTKALVWQLGSDYNYMPTNQTTSEGNSDQSIWGLAAMTAAESNFPAPPSSSGVKSWLQVAENVFNTQAARWNTKVCGGGLRWQIFTFNAGYNVMDSMSNGNFFQLAARLAHYTGNKTYVEWAENVAQWSIDIGLLHDDHVYSNTETLNNCTTINHVQWTATMGTYLAGFSFLANITAPSTKWSAVPTNLFTSTQETFGVILSEVVCTPSNDCDAEIQTYRAILGRALATLRSMVPSAVPLSNKMVQGSALGAAGQCSGGSSGTTCGTNWNTTKYDGTKGLGQELSAMEIILANLPAAKLDTATSTQTTTTPGSPSSTTMSTSAGSKTTTGTPSGTTSNIATSTPNVAAAGMRNCALAGSLVAALGVGVAVLA